jgi:hypothetical protein
MHDLNGAEFPPGSGYRLKVMPAEILVGGATPGASSASAHASSTAAPGGGGGALRDVSAAAAAAAAAGMGSGRPPRSPAVGGPVAASLVGSTGPSPAHTPLHRNLSQEIAAVQDSLSSLSLPGTLGGHDSALHHHHQQQQHQQQQQHHAASMNGDATPSSLHQGGPLGGGHTFGSTIGSPAPHHGGGSLSAPWTPPPPPGPRQAGAPPLARLAP